MNETKKRYWKGLEEFKNDPEFVKNADKEFPEYLPINNESGNSRRDFLKMMGFGVAAASLAACEAPVRKAIPYVNKPDTIDPGIPNYYASTYFEAGDYASVVVKTREGRPIKIEGNDLSPLSQGGTSAQAQASVLSLYDKERLTGARKGGSAIDWTALDAEVSQALSAVASGGGQIRIVTNTVISPSLLSAIDQFKATYPGAEVVSYDTQSASGMLEANEQGFGTRAIPSYDFSKAQTIVSFDADFLGGWLSGSGFAKQYAKNRKVNAGNRNMSRHYHFESNLSLTGANADYRSMIKPSQAGSVVLSLYNMIATKAGSATVGSSQEDVRYLKKAANDLWNQRGKSLVVSGSNDPAVQTLVNGINEMLGNYGQTVSFDRASHLRKGDDKAMDAFINDLKAGSVGGVIFHNCNPVYNHARGAEIAEGVAKASVSVSTSDRMDETASVVTYVAPDHHYLEAWGDAEPRTGSYSLTQPTISPLFDTRQAGESILSWSGNDATYFDFVKEYWRANMYMDSYELGFQHFWDKSLQDGVYEVDAQTAELTSAHDFSSAASAIAANYKSGSGFELALYYKIGVGDGTHANNPWLQEMPDPITKGVWDNYLTVAPSDAADLGIESKLSITNKATLSAGGQTFSLPVIIQPGQTKGTVGLALGYGRAKGGRVANNLGVDATALTGMLNGHKSLTVTSGVSVAGESETYQVAQTQTHSTYMGRDNVIQETLLADYKEDPKNARSFNPKIATWLSEEGKVHPNAVSLWRGHKYPNHHWGLMIDLNSCTGCSACTIACQSENNIPVVGREEVINRREMHWLRIDRYYSSDADGGDDLRAMEVASENPEVTFQPMMCQQCNNAPCETVCPVAATTHSTEGLNMMAYNRCIGTRYCANNCPYKVRRFNWFKYHDNKQFANNTSMNNDLGKMVLNPDVVVRSRGVMEKCTFCVQRLQAGKLAAKLDNRRPVDGEINVACASSCPSEALVFGDMNDPNSKISKLLKIKDYEGDGEVEKTMAEERAYTVLEEVGTRPNVVYLSKIRNKDKEEVNA